MRVLIVEDEERMARALVRGLAAEGMAVDVASDGETGLHLAREETYDAVVLDVRLPKLSGYRVCQAAPRRGQLGADPDAVGEDRRVRPGRRSGCRGGRLPDQAVLVRRPRRPAARPRAPRRSCPTKVLTAGDLELDPAARTVRRGPDDISLTPREFGVLELLLRRSGEVVSKREILDNVWDAHYEGDDNVVEVYVGYLRRKIDQPYGRKAVETVRGAGYRLAKDGG